MKIERFTIEGKKSNKPYIRRTKKITNCPFIYIEKQFLLAHKKKNVFLDN